MKHIISLLVLSGLVGCTHLASVQNSPAPLPQGVTEEMVSPPPVPRFLLKPPTQPLTMEEMMQQVREAEAEAGIKRP
jgi:hypothetical protein